ncbi:uncharacterized protein LOC131672610 [Phymastichus coffea]|uniref:uncharacterized protein LOC131672610 n=1 Tax=Phymastichus coffea TaxID=108790 RepID=UPI00273C1E86|nr:uncharacterized protein LOC131672610 [Phymastichus coffea]
MKASFALFGVICIVGVYFASHCKIKAEIDECARVNNIGEDVFNDLKAGKDPAPSRDLDCFSACVLKHNEVMNAEGSTNHKPNESDVTKQCKDLSAKNDCDTVDKIMSGLHKNNLIPKI